MSTEELSEKEAWVKIPNWEGYEVSSLGRVKSFKRDREMILKTHKNIKGYECVNLKQRPRHLTARVHKLVYVSFKGDTNGLTIDHVDGNKLNNRLSNLEAVTYRENMNRGIKNGLFPHGHNHHCRKLDDCKILTIITYEAAGRTMKEAYDVFGVSSGSVSSAVSGVAWERYKFGDIRKFVKQDIAHKALEKYRSGK